MAPNCNPAKSRLCPGGRACVSVKKQCGKKKTPNPNAKPRNPPKCREGVSRLCPGGRACVSLKKCCKGDKECKKAAPKQRVAKGFDGGFDTALGYVIPDKANVVDKSSFELGMKAHRLLEGILRRRPEGSMTEKQKKALQLKRRQIRILFEAALKNKAPAPRWKRKREEVEEAAEDIPFPVSSGDYDYGDGQTGVI
jgi:hypothetical protein